MLPTPPLPSQEWAEMRFSCVTGDPERLKKALDKPDTDVNEKAGYGETVLFQACYDGEFECAKLLLDAKANPNIVAGGKEAPHTPLHQAAYWGPDHGRKEDALKIVQLLLERGADPLAADKVGNTAAEFARRRKAVPEIVAVLEAAESAAASG